MARRSRVLNIGVVADPSKFSKGMDKVDARARKSERTLDHMGRTGASHFGKLAKAAAGAAAAYVGIAEAKQAVNVTTDLAKATLTLNKSFGLSVKTASEFAAVARARGAETKPLTMGFKALATAVRNAGVSGGSALKPFQELGITQRELAGAHGDLDKVIRMVSKGLGDMPAGANKAALSAKLFGRTWTSLAPILRSGTKDMDEQLHMADKYGATFSKQGLGSMEDFIKAQREAKLATLGLQVAFGTKLAPILTQVILKVAHFVQQMRTGRGAGGRFADMLTKAGDVLKVVYAGLHELGVSFRHFGRWLSTADANVRQFARGVKDGLVNAWHTAERVFGNVMAGILRGFAKLFDAGSHLPGLGGKFGGLRDKAEAAARKVDRLGEAVKQVPKDKKVTIQMFARMRIGGGEFEGGPSGGPELNERLDGFAKSEGKKWLARHPTFGQLGGLLPSGKGVGRFLPLAQKFGLSLTSFLRPGDTGSLHSVGRAMDFSNGTATRQELAFARFMASNFGGRLAELIHTPLGFGIKNGQRVPLSFWGASTNAQHYNHVHVALQRGGMIPGAGDGDRVPVMAEPGEGFINKRAVRALGGRSAIDAINSALPRFQGGGTVPKEYARLFRMAASRFNVPARFLAGLTKIESGFNQNLVSPAGARGATQFMPGTAPTYGVQFGPGHHALATQIFGAAKYLNALGFQHDPRTALAKYNGGPGNPQFGYASDVLEAAAGYAGIGDGPGAGGEAHQPPLVWNGERWVRRTQRRGVRMPRRGETRGEFRQFLRHTRQPAWWRRPGETRQHYRQRTTQKQRERNKRWLRRQQPRGKKPEHVKVPGAEARNAFQQAFADQLALDEARAALTPDTADDLAAAQKAERGWLAFMQLAQAKHDTAAETTAAQNLASARDRIAELTAAPENQAEANLAEEVKALREEMARTNAIFNSATAVTARELQKALSDSVSGSMGVIAGQRARAAGDGLTGWRN